MNSDICVGELHWPKYLEPNHKEQQQRDLQMLAESAGKGLILDCSLVEIGNSEIISLLMRVRNHAKKAGKEITLINVPETLSNAIRLCKLTSVIPAAQDAAAAKKMIYDLSRGKSKLRMLVEAKPALSGVVIAAACIGIGLICYLTIG